MRALTSNEHRSLQFDASRCVDVTRRDAHCGICVWDALSTQNHGHDHQTPNPNSMSHLECHVSATVFLKYCESSFF